LEQHIDGTPFRALASQYNISPMTAYRYVMSELKKLPHCADVSRNLCSKFCGILLVDGKFLKIKGYESKIPVIYGIDYLTHDIPNFRLAPAESYLVCLKFFESLRLLNYPLKSLVSDDNPNFLNACKIVYPKVIWQLCLVHFMENIRKSLSVRTDDTYKPFMREIEILFKIKRTEDDFNRVAKNIFNRYKIDNLCVTFLLDIDRRKRNFMAHLWVKHTPRTNNLIESFNSHLQGRLKTIKGFESFSHAELWLNAYFLRRRTKKFTDCEGKFKYLNGKSSIEITSGNKLIF